jgi:DNA repair protein RadD
VSEVVLRDYQARAVESLREGIRAGHRKQVLMSPTGSGKTEIACHMLQEAGRKRSKALFIVDRVVLVDQTSERLDRYRIPHGVIQAGHWRFRTYETLQVCSAQTIERRGIPEGVSVVFVDEAHCMRKKVTEFIAATDAEKEIEERGLDIIGDIVAEWQNKTEHHFGGPVKTIVFSATVDHGAELCRQFNAAGFNFQQISYKDGGDEHRRELIEEFRKPDSTIHGLISCEVFTKGFDVPDVMCGVSARPYRKSLSSHIQQMGRVMRASPGKSFALWLDHSGNVLRFMGDTVEIFQDGCTELDDGKRESKARKEPTPQQREQIRCSCGYAQQRGYQPGWCAHQYHAKFGVWPNDPRLKVPAGPVTLEVQNWIRSQQIRFAKTKQAAAA